MKRKFWVVLLMVLTALCLCFGFAACGETEKPKPSLPEEGYAENGLCFWLNFDGESYTVYEGKFNGSTLVIPETFNGAPVTVIAGNAFSDCSGLTSIIIPDSVTSILGNAFNGTAYYKNDSNWTGNVLYIGKYLIEAKNTILGSYAIREGTKTIADYAFEDCSGLTSINIPDSVTSIGSYAFRDCSGLTSINIPDSVTSIGWGAFEDCSGLTSIDIPDSVTSIGYNAFLGCSGLTSITIGSGVTSIGWGAFSGCSGLTKIQYNGTINAWKQIEKDNPWGTWDGKTGDYTVYCTDGTITKEGVETKY